jgi:response regulator RpfG family c-di-GMP phosphodiesterase
MLMHEQPSQDEKSYEILREKTELGANIAKRIQLAQKCVDLTRSTLEETLNDKVIAEMNAIQPEIESQIILLSDLYITMRDPKPYKRPLTHVMVVKLLSGELGKCFDQNLINRFLKFHEDFSELYRNF